MSSHLNRPLKSYKGGNYAGGFTLQTMSLITGASDGLFSINNQQLGLVDNWTIGIWARINTNTLPLSYGIMGWRDTSGASKNTLQLATRPSNPFDSLIFQYTDNSANARQVKEYGSVLGVSGPGGGPWRHWVLSWDGTVGGTVFYLNASAQAPLFTSSDLDSSTIANPSTTKVSISGTQGTSRWPGPIYSVAIWKTILTSSAVTDIYNGGNGRDFDLNSNSGNYTQASSLAYYYRVGIGSTATDFGKDRGNQAPNADLELNGLGPLDSNDLTTDIPV